ncbi:hypothetical protein ATPR_0524 [Acetobacter tropicalis NBRC 101654]|uniref:Uncharacterized protein n=1 Tax=Acetobacter tropicalis NBRC 101654 TaxID=749388 RepID=F7VAX5_9PROT|nr:hypothetical protein ATPR_0524 [Acetobacter tropicalis NBRC 101654]
MLVYDRSAKGMRRTIGLRMRDERDFQERFATRCHTKMDFSLRLP